MVDVGGIKSIKKRKEKLKRKRVNENDTYVGKTSQMGSKMRDRSVEVAQLKKDKKSQLKKKKETSQGQSNTLGEEDDAIDAEPDHTVDEQNVSSSIEVVRKKKNKKSPRRKKKEKSERQSDVPDAEVSHMDAEPGHSVAEQNVGSSFEVVQEKKKKKSRQRQEKEEREGQSDVPSDQVNHIVAGGNLSVHEQNDDSFEVVRKKKDKKLLRRKKKEKREGQSDVSGELKKDNKRRKKDCILSGEGGSFEKGEPVLEDIYEISSGDEDCSKGMRKWLMEYHQSRPGLKALQQQIDEFIVAHEEKLEQERKEREALAAEGGWTVVTHHKGRKKTTDLESGTVVGSVSQASLEDKMAKKKHNEVALDFYRFQRREAQRNEVVELQSKFEQDKKRIQQLRAARKFRPY